MPTLIDQTLPYKIYSATNLGSNEGMVYLGKIPNNLNFSTKIYSDDFYQNCFSGYYFSIASLVPGNFIRMDIADTADSNILVDAKWFDFRPCSIPSCDASTWPTDSVLYNVDYSDPMVTTPTFKSLSTDGTVVISGLESGFIWNDEGINDSGLTSHCTLYLQAWVYKFKNACNDQVGAYYGTIGTPGVTDVIFLMKSLVGDRGIVIKDLGNTLLISYDPVKECFGHPPTPISCEPFISPDVAAFL